MLPDEVKKRQEILNNYIFELSDGLFDRDDNKTEFMAAKLSVVYTDDFRHNYSDFFPVILNIFDDKNNHSKDYLLENIEELRQLVEVDFLNGFNKYKNMYNQFSKLCDHLNLQIAQLNFISVTEKKLDDSNINLKSANKNLMESKKELESANDKAKSIQTELIAVLSIFAAIVISFSGGLTFLGSVMTSIAQAEIHKLVMVALICGIVLFNTIFLLMYFVAKITERNIYARCETEDCTCIENKPKCKGITRIRKRLPYVYYFNIYLAVLLMADILAWILL